jgi:hypothetical protein
VITIAIAGMIFIILMTAIILLIYLIKTGKLKNIKIGDVKMSSESESSDEKKEIVVNINNGSNNSSTATAISESSKDNCKGCKNYYIVNEVRHDTTNAVRKIDQLLYIDHINSGSLLVNTFVKKSNEIIYNNYIISLCKTANEIEDLLRINEFNEISNKLDEDLRKYLNNRFRLDNFETKVIGSYDKDGKYVKGSWDLYKDTTSQFIKSIYLQSLNIDGSSNNIESYQISYIGINKLWSEKLSFLIDTLFEDLRSISVETQGDIKEIINRYNLDEADFL